MCGFIEDLIRGEEEQLAERTFENDYCSLSGTQRYQLRLVVIARLGAAVLWPDDGAAGERGHMARLLLTNVPHDCSETYGEYLLNKVSRVFPELRSKVL